MRAAPLHGSSFFFFFFALCTASQAALQQLVDFLIRDIRQRCSVEFREVSRIFPLALCRLSVLSNKSRKRERERESRNQAERKAKKLQYPVARGIFHFISPRELYGREIRERETLPARASTKLLTLSEDA